MGREGVGRVLGVCGGKEVANVQEEGLVVLGGLA